jgi:pentose-5-phosphate-3-epimerase
MTVNLGFGHQHFLQSTLPKIRRVEADYADKLLSAMRFEFGWHLEKPKEKSEAA